MNRIFLILALISFLPSRSQPRTDSLLKDLLVASQNQIVHNVVNNPVGYRCQIIYTQIDRNRFNEATFTNYYFNYDPDLYYNPASTVKLPLAFLALEKLRDMKIKKVNKYTAMQFDSSYERQTKAYHDSTSENFLPSIAHYIKKAFLISDNDAYNRLYQFVGQKEIHKSLWQKGYRNTRIPRQFMGFTEEQNRRSNPIRFIDRNGRVIYSQPMLYNPDTFDFSRQVRIGKGYMNRNDSLILQPFDFTRQNNIPLEDLLQILRSVMFPESVPEQQRFELSKDDYRFLYRWLSQYPSETPYPKYDEAKFYDSYVKFFFRDSSKRIPHGVRVFSKVGWAYGFLTDVSYVADFKNRVEYMLAATIYVNSDSILNDNKYDYDSIGYPFLREIGRVIYEYELKRARRFKPDLTRFRIEYDTRDPNDKRATIQEVDN